MGNLHEALITKNAKRLRSQNFIVVPNAHFKNFIFDIFAANPEQHEMKIVEIVIGHDGLEAKRQFCELNGIDLEIIEPDQKSLPYDDQVVTDLSLLYSVLADKRRLLILKILNDHPMTASELLFSAGYPVGSGHGFYHLQILLKAHLIERHNDLYQLTSLGIKYVPASLM